MFRIPFSCSPLFPSSWFAVAFVGLLLWPPTRAEGAKITLRWADNSNNESGFKIERAVGNGGFSQIATTARGVASYVDATVTTNTTYRYKVRAYNGAGNSAYSNTTSITVVATPPLPLPPPPGSPPPGSPPPTSNTPPNISAIANRTIPMNGTTGAIFFTISDSQTPASNLTLIKNASDQSLVPLGNITFGGSGTNRSVTIRPVSNKSGWSTIWVKVSDGKLDRYVSFVLTVTGKPVGGVGSVGAMVAPSIGLTSVVSIGAAGAASANLSLAGAGLNVSAAVTTDQLRFSNVSLKGDTELTVQVTGLKGSDDQTRAGLMFRNSTAANSACVGVLLTGTSRLLLVWRATAGGPLQTRAALTGSVPQWLRVTRVGDAFYGFTSKDGVKWDLVEFANVDLTDTVLGGTAAMTPGGATATTATFAQFEVD
jgi:hypothetical protein